MLVRCVYARGGVSEAQFQRPRGSVTLVCLSRLWMGSLLLLCCFCCHLLLCCKQRLVKMLCDPKWNTPHVSAGDLIDEAAITQAQPSWSVVRYPFAIHRASASQTMYVQAVHSRCRLEIEGASCIFKVQARDRRCKLDIRIYKLQEPFIRCAAHTHVIYKLGGARPFAQDLRANVASALELDSKNAADTRRACGCQNIFKVAFWVQLPSSHCCFRGTRDCWTPSPISATRDSPLCPSR
jgi:hypothetical protein